MSFSLHELQSLILIDLLRGSQVIIELITLVKLNIVISTYLIKSTNLFQVLGMVLTSFFLLLQFQNPFSQTVEATCHCALYDVVNGNNVTDNYIIDT